MTQDGVWPLEDLVRQLSPEQQAVVRNLVDSLLAQEADLRSAAQEVDLSWAGALAHLHDEYASGVDLQHGIMREWAGER